MQSVVTSAVLSNAGFCSRMADAIVTAVSPPTPAIIKSLLPASAGGESVIFSALMHSTLKDSSELEGCCCIL